LAYADDLVLLSKDEEGMKRNNEGDGKIPKKQNIATSS